MTVDLVKEKLNNDYVNDNLELFVGYLDDLNVHVPLEEIKNFLYIIFEGSRTLLQGYKNQTKIAGLLYAFCFLFNQKRTQKEIQLITGISLVSIRKVFNVISPVIKQYLVIR